MSETLLTLKPSEKVTFQEPSTNIPRLPVSSMSPLIAPPDAEPLPPYDPITNYLSPRPQFLRYKPNPRIQLYLHKLKMRGGKSLEESLLSDSLSDTEDDSGSEESSSEEGSHSPSPSAHLATEEETGSEEISSEEGSPSPSTDLTTYSVVRSAEGEGDPSSEPVSSSLVRSAEGEGDPSSEPVSSSVVRSAEELEGDSLVAALNPSTTVEVKRWWKIIGLLVFLLVASSSLSLTESPVFKATSYRDLGMSTFYNPSEIAGASFHVLVRGFKQVTTSCMSYLSRLSQIAGNLEPVQFANLTTLLENPFDDCYFKETHIAERPVEQVYAQEDDSENVEEIEGEGEQPLEESLEAYTESEVITMDDNLQESESIEAEGEGEAIEVSIEETGPYIEAEGEGEGIEVSLEETEPYIEAEGESMIQLQSDEFVANSDFQDQSVTVEAPEQVLEAKPELVSSGDTQHLEDLASGDAERNPEVDSSLPNLFGDNKFSDSYKQAVLPLVVFPLVVLALVIISTAKEILTKKMNPENEERTEVDAMGEPCPSKMSFFEKTSSYYSNREYRETTANEAQSQERKQKKVSKRESSSFDFSMSPSYGSFTTYEKIPSKHGYVIMTPVRRSSRIKKFTSP